MTMMMYDDDDDDVDEEGFAVRVFLRKGLL